ELRREAILTLLPILRDAIAKKRSWFCPISGDARGCDSCIRQELAAGVKESPGRAGALGSTEETSRGRTLDAPIPSRAAQIRQGADRVSAPARRGALDDGPGPHNARGVKPQTRVMTAANGPLVGEHERIVGKLNGRHFLCVYHHLERFNRLTYRGGNR